MNIFSELKQEIIKVVLSLYPESNISNINTEFPKDPLNGDIATNAAMILAPQLQKSPREIAMQIHGELKDISYIAHIEVAGPGFINFTIKLERWHNYIDYILEKDIKFGDCDIGKSKKVNLEYVSANPTGPMHIGHARGAVYGDVLANLLKKSGYDVTKEYYINDAGVQMDVLSESIYLRYLEIATKKSIDIPEGLYPGEYLIPVAQQIFDKYATELVDFKKDKYTPLIKEISIDAMMKIIKDDLADMGIHHDVFFSESSLHESKSIDKEVNVLKEKSLVYIGKLEPPKGKEDKNWEGREQLLFRTTDYGDDQDRPLQKSDNSWTYFAADIAYAADKINRGFNNIVMVVGSDHAGYVKRIEAVINAVSNQQASVDVKTCQLVNFIKDGKPVKMSKRAGTFTTVRDVIEAVGKDIIRFMMLTRKNDALMDFDLDKVKETSKDNPVFYVQYACVRALSILNNCREQMPNSYLSFEKGEANLSVLSTEEEVRLIKLLASWPKIVENASIQCEPHRIAFYLQELAASFHSMWNYGKDNPNFRFMIEGEEELTAARMNLVSAISVVLRSGLDVMGIKPMEKM